MEKLLDVENVSISFIQYTQGLNQRDLKVITDLTLDISEGEILAVLGSSGSGKSLLAHAIFGILPENANLNGKIKYKGKELSQKDKEEIRGKDIALIPSNTTTSDQKWMKCTPSNYPEEWQEEYSSQQHYYPTQN